jgi:subtilase family serine protease
MRKESTYIEPLEHRLLLSASLKHEALVVPNSHVLPAVVGTAPAGFTPAQIRRAYGFDNVTFGDGTIQGDGEGQTIAIVDAYNQTNITSDLGVFNQAFSLPAMDGQNGNPTFSVVLQPQQPVKYHGKWVTPTIPTNASWAVEVSLDVEWAHAIAPQANIMLFEAADNTYTNMLTMIDTARKTANVSVVSMSFSGTESSTELSRDAYLTTPAGHGGITFVACTGDVGAPAQWPATNPNVVSVGGTTLTTDADGNYISESGWSGSGGGVSAYENKPAYQSALPYTMRATPDISYNAAQASHYSVYDTITTPSGSSGWITVYGTSAGAPQVSALVAIANQGRAQLGQPTLDGAQTLNLIYAAPSTDFHDIVTGGSTGTPAYPATPGYDLATGLGTPFADSLIKDLLA